MQSLVGDLLLLAQTDEGAEKPPMERLDLTDLVEGELLQFESVAFERKVELRSQLEPGVAVCGNAPLLRKLAGTLLDNACKYTNAGGTVTVTLRAHASEAVLSVRNSGEPIDEADLPHLFDRFYRADAARTHNAADAENNGGEPGANTGGYGLGLAIARDIAQAHKGTIAVTSTAQEGTTFTLRLPLA